MWFAEIGDGDTLVALHPGGADSRALDALVAELPEYRVITPDQRGHVRTADVPGPASFEAMAAETADLIEGRSERPVHLFGYSDGAIVALELALSRPDLVRDVVLAAGVFHHDGWLPGVLDGDAPDFMADSYGEVSPDGRSHWPQMVKKLADLHRIEPRHTTDDLRRLDRPVLVMIGDDDEPRLEHILEMYRALPHGELAVVPRATHGFVVEKPKLVAGLIRDFHATDKTDGFAPIRRRR